MNSEDEVRMMVIRRATAFDAVNLSRMLMQSREEQARDIFYPPVPEGDRGEMFVMQHVLALIDKGLVIVASLEKGGRLQGCIGMAVSRMDWSEEWMLMNEWFYVIPKHRDTDIARNLLKAVHAWADADIDWAGNEKPKMAVMMGMVSGKQTGLKNKFMEQLGYDYGGGNFVRAPQHEQVEEDDADDSPGNTRVA